jgi:mannosyltransferase OCH1-like enzyme
MWIGKPMPDWIKTCIETWAAVYDVRLWTEPPELINKPLWNDAHRISPLAPEQFRADVARYEILYQFGGVWTDADMELVTPIDELVTPAWCGWEVQDRWVGNSILGAAEGHPLLAEIIEGLPRNSRLHQANTRKSGPQYITPFVQRYALDPLYPVTIYPEAYFYPYSYRELHRMGEAFPDSYTIHHWNNRRRVRTSAQRR